jgi:hypothetical protein
MSVQPKHVIMVAVVCGVAGVALAVGVYRSWREYRSYSVEAVGTVKERTDDSIIVALEGDIPGGHGYLEQPYSALTAGQSAAPDGNDLKVGDKLALLHPPGKPSAARLIEGFQPAVPLWLGWLSAGLIVVAASLAWWVWRRQRSRPWQEAEPANRPKPATMGSSS